jgi:hypothetical protein
MKSTIELTSEQEAQAQDLATRITEAIASDVLSMARLLVSRDTHHTFGQTELDLRDIILRAGAKALETSLAQKKMATTARVSLALSASRKPSSRATATRAP